MVKVGSNMVGMAEMEAARQMEREVVINLSRIGTLLNLRTDTAKFTMDSSLDIYSARCRHPSFQLCLESQASNRLLHLSLSHLLWRQDAS